MYNNYTYIYACTYVANLGSYVRTYVAIITGTYIFNWPRIITIIQIKHVCCDFV